MKRRYGEIDNMLRGASTRLLRVHDGTGDSGLAMHRPGFRVTDAPLSDEDDPKASGNDATPVDDIDDAYRRYADEICEAWKTPR